MRRLAVVRELLLRMVGFRRGAPGGVIVGTRMVLVKVVGTFLLPLGFLGGGADRLCVLSMPAIICDRFEVVFWGCGWGGTRVALWFSEPTMSATARELVMTSGRKYFTGFWAISRGS